MSLSYVIQTEVEQAFRAIFALNGDITNRAAVGSIMDLQQEEIYPPAVIVEADAFANDGGMVGWPLYIGPVYVRTVTAIADDTTREMCELVNQYMLDSVNSTGFAAAMNNQLSDKNITYLGATCEPGTPEYIDEESLNEIGYTFQVRVQA